MALRRLTALILCLGLLLASPAFAALLGACPMGGLFSGACACQEDGPVGQTKLEARAGCCCELAEPATVVPVVLGAKPAPAHGDGAMHAMAAGSIQSPVAGGAAGLRFCERSPPGPSRALFIEQASLLL